MAMVYSVVATGRAMKGAARFMTGSFSRTRAERRLGLRRPKLTVPSTRCASSAKSIIMIAFFLTMPISRMTPMIAMMSRSAPEQTQRE
jgi:hypothetical protein